MAGRSKSKIKELFMGQRNPLTETRYAEGKSKNDQNQKGLRQAADRAIRALMPARGVFNMREAVKREKGKGRQQEESREFKESVSAKLQHSFFLGLLPGRIIANLSSRKGNPIKRSGRAPDQMVKE